MDNSMDWKWNEALKQPWLKCYSSHIFSTKFEMLLLLQFTVEFKAYIIMLPKKMDNLKNL